MTEKPQIRPYPLEVWFKDNEDSDKHLVYVEELKKKHNVWYDCQPDGQWWICRVVDNDNTTNMQTVKKDKSKTGIKELLDKL